MSISSVVQESQGNPRHVLAMRAEDCRVARAEGNQMPVLGRMKQWKSILICYFPREVRTPQRFCCGRQALLSWLPCPGIRKVLKFTAAIFRSQLSRLPDEKLRSTHSGGVVEGNPFGTE